MGFWFYAAATSLFISIFVWPYVKELEYTVWYVHWETCAERYTRNEELLKSKMCDKGTNELAYKDKVDCARARDENAWGITFCAVTKRLQENTASDTFRHVWQSWYTTGFILFVVFLALKYGITGFWETKKHEISTKAHANAYRAALTYGSRDRQQNYLEYTRGNRNQFSLARQKPSVLSSRGSYYYQNGDDDDDL